MSVIRGQVGLEYIKGREACVIRHLGCINKLKMAECWEVYADADLYFHGGQKDQVFVGINSEGFPEWAAADRK